MQSIFNKPIPFIILLVAANILLIIFLRVLFAII